MSRRAGLLLVSLVMVLAGITRLASAQSAALPYPWSSDAVGDVGTSGTATVSGGTFTVSGAGADIWGSADSFQFVDQHINESGEIQARVTSLQNTNTYAKAGVMFRASLDPGAPAVVVDVKPDGGVEFMARTTWSGNMDFLAGTSVQLPTYLKLTRTSGTVESIVTAWVWDAAATGWTQLGYVTVPIPYHGLAGLAVTSHDRSQLNTATFDSVRVVSNLLEEGGFEGYAPPDLGLPGWVSDNPLRQIVAKSEYNQPHNGAKNGACWATTDEDCGMYQEVTAPDTGTYVLTIFANADRTGGLVGVNVNGSTATSTAVDVRGFGNYGSYSLAFSATAGDTIRVWMYSPATPGYVVIDDAVLNETFAGEK